MVGKSKVSDYEILQQIPDSGIAFMDLFGKVPIAKSSLSERLKRLERDGSVSRTNGRVYRTGATLNPNPNSQPEDPIFEPEPELPTDSNFNNHILEGDLDPEPELPTRTRTPNPNPNSQPEDPIFDPEPELSNHETLLDFDFDNILQWMRDFIKTDFQDVIPLEYRNFLRILTDPEEGNASKHRNISYSRRIIRDFYHFLQRMQEGFT